VPEIDLLDVACKRVQCTSTGPVVGKTKPDREDGSTHIAIRHPRSAIVKSRPSPDLEVDGSAE